VCNLTEAAATGIVASRGGFKSLWSSHYDSTIITVTVYYQERYMIVLQPQLLQLEQQFPHIA